MSEISVKNSRKQEVKIFRALTPKIEASFFRYFRPPAPTVVILNYFEPFRLSTKGIMAVAIAIVRFRKKENKPFFFLNESSRLLQSWTYPPAATDTKSPCKKIGKCSVLSRLSEHLCPAVYRKFAIPVPVIASLSSMQFRTMSIYPEIHENITFEWLKNLLQNLQCSSTKADVGYYVYHGSDRNFTIRVYREILKENTVTKNAAVVWGKYRTPP